MSEVHPEQTFQYHARSVMRTGTESLMGIYHDIIFGRRQTMMLRAMNQNTVGDSDRFKAVAFPFLVPILIFRFCQPVGHFHPVHGKYVCQAIQYGTLEKSGLHISFHPLWGIYKTFQTGIGYQCYQDVGSIPAIRGYNEIQFQIFHIVYFMSRIYWFCKNSKKRVIY